MGRPIVAVYARCSTKVDQDPQVQIKVLREYCQARGWTVDYELIDHGYSGGTDQRPALKQLLGLVRSRKVSVVCVVKLDRLFRSLKSLVLTLEEFHELGIQFIAVRDSIDWTTSAGRLFAQVLGCLAEFEKSLIRERTLLGLEYARSQGKTLGRPKKRNDDAIAELHKRGLSYKKIAHQLGCSEGQVYRALKTTSKTPTEHIESRSKKSEGCDG